MLFFCVYGQNQQIGYQWLIKTSASAAAAALLILKNKTTWHQPWRLCTICVFVLNL